MDNFVTTSTVYEYDLQSFFSAFTSFSVNFFKQNLVLAGEDWPPKGLLTSFNCVTYLHVV